VELFKRLLEKGANPNMIDEFQRTVLHHACNFADRKDYSQMYNLLLKHKVDIMAQDFKGRTPLHYLFVKSNQRNKFSKYDPLNLGLSTLI
jgi:ankyrin repeat protein